MLLLLVLLSICNAGTIFKIQKFYSQDVTCSNQFTSWFVTEVATCTPVATCENLNGNAGSTTECSIMPPNYPAGWITFEAYQTLDCSDAPSVGASPMGQCTGVWIGSPWSIKCVGIECELINCKLAIVSCAGCPWKRTSGTNTCVQGNPTDGGYTMLAFVISPPTVTTTATITTTATTGVSTTSTTISNTTSPSGFHTMVVFWGLVWILVLTLGV